MRNSSVIEAKPSNTFQGWLKDSNKTEIIHLAQ